MQQSNFHIYEFFNLFAHACALHCHADITLSQLVSVYLATSRLSMGSARAYIFYIWAYMGAARIEPEPEAAYAVAAVCGLLHTCG